MGELLADDDRLSNAEFMRRLRARFIERGGEGADEVADSVTVGEWREAFANEPEEAADEEMSYWTDDGDE
jgi:hypothetical protein